MTTLVRMLLLHYSGEELSFPLPTRADPATVSYRSLWRRVAAQTIAISRQRPNGDAWTT
jgi:hypothetical protein